MLFVAAGDAVAFVVGVEGIGVDPEVVAVDTIHTTRYRCLGGCLVSAKTLWYLTSKYGRWLYTSITDCCSKAAKDSLRKKEHFIE